MANDDVDAMHLARVINPTGGTHYVAAVGKSDFAGITAQGEEIAEFTMPADRDLALYFGIIPLRHVVG